MGKIEARRLKGFRDYLPDLMEARRYYMRIAEEEATKAGFRPIATPTLEYATTLLGQGSDETDKQVYKFVDHGKRNVALRFDLTLPMARFIAEHQGKLVFPLRTIHQGQVFRGENPQKGRYREFAQCDLDILGSDTMAADVEVLSTLASALSRFELGSFTMRIGHRGVLSAMIRQAFGVDVPETEVLIAVDKLDKIGPEKVATLLVEKTGCEEQAATKFINLLQSDSWNSASEEEVVAAGIPADVWQRYVATVRALDGLQIANATISLDLSIARGLGYYTGVVFETALDAMPEIGSVSSGGRYNDLVSRFSSRELPGVGGSLGLDRLIGALEESGALPDARDRTVMVAVTGDDVIGFGLDLVHELRSNGIAAELGIGNKLKKQFVHGDRMGCPLVVTVGSDEANGSKPLTVKTMASGEEETLSRADIVAGIKKKMK